MRRLNWAAGRRARATLAAIAALTMFAPAQAIAYTSCIPVGGAVLEFFHEVGSPTSYDCQMTRYNGNYAGTSAYATPELNDPVAISSTQPCTSVGGSVIAYSGGTYYQGPRVNDTTAGAAPTPTSYVTNKLIIGAVWYWTRYGVYDVAESTTVFGC